MWNGGRTLFCAVSHLQCFAAQEECTYDEAILSQNSDYFLHNCPIHISSSKISYNQAACRIVELWLADLLKYYNRIHYTICNWVQISYFHDAFMCTEWAKGKGTKLFFMVPRKRSTFSLEDSILVILNQEALHNACTDLSIIQDHLI
jgi:hypothetical protein